MIFSVQQEGGRKCFHRGFLCILRVPSCPHPMLDIVWCKGRPPYRAAGECWNPVGGVSPLDGGSREAKISALFLSKRTRKMRSSNVKQGEEGSGFSLLVEGWPSLGPL